MTEGLDLLLQRGTAAGAGVPTESWGRMARGGGGAVQPLPLGFNRLVAYLTCPYHVMNQTLFPQI